MIKILIVEDEKPISDLISLSLSGVGYSCTAAYDGFQAADLLESHSYDLVLLDIMLPKADGYEVLEYIRPLGIPVIFLTAKGSLEERVRGLTLGAEDYIVKPFEIIELIARVQVVLRRFNKLNSTLSYLNLSIDLDNQIVKKENEPLSLTQKEFELLVLLVRNKNITLFREQIYESIWEKDFYGDTRTLDLHIQRLRKKTGIGDHLKAIYKVGYRLEDDSDEISK